MYYLYNFKLKIGFSGLTCRIISPFTKKFLGRGILAGHLFRAVWRLKGVKGIKGAAIVVNQSRPSLKNDGCTIFSNVTIATILKKKFFRKVSRFGFFFNLRNNKKFVKKYRIIL